MHLFGNKPTNKLPVNFQLHTKHWAGRHRVMEIKSERQLNTKRGMADNRRQERPNLYRRISDNHKTETGRQTKRSQKMATNMSPSRHTKLPQTSERIKTPVTNPQKRGCPKSSPRPDAN